MPQLNPSPWFMVFCLAWVFFLVVLPIKTSACTYPDELTAQLFEQLIFNHWLWPW